MKRLDSRPQVSLAREKLIGFIYVDVTRCGLASHNKRWDLKELNVQADGDVRRCLCSRRAACCLEATSVELRGRAGTERCWHLPFLFAHTNIPVDKQPPPPPCPACVAGNHKVVVEEEEEELDGI